MKTAPPPNPRRIFPLYGKIMLWFLVNVLLVGGAVFWLLQEEFGLDRAWLLTRDGRARLQWRAEQVVEQVRAAGPGRDQIDEVLAQLGEQESMSFALYDFSGVQVGGETMPLPPQLRQRLGGGGPGGRPRGNAPRADAPGPPQENPGDFRPRSVAGAPGDDHPARTTAESRRRERLMETEGRGARIRRGESRPMDFPKEALRTETPTRYWVIARLPPMAESTGRARPLALVGMAESLGQSRLLFDPKPWIWGGLGLLASSALLWWPFVRGLTRSLEQMRAAAGRVARGDFAVRVDDRRGDELGQLGEAINAMTGRLEGFVHGQKRFLGDIAHELCSPLARMEMALGVLEHRAPPALQEHLNDVREEVREMSTLVDELLAFSKAGLQDTNAAREKIALAPLLREAITREAGGLEISLLVPEDITVLAVPALLERAVGNILRNAAHHAGPRGLMEITAVRTAASQPKPDAEMVRLTLADHGPGVPPEALPKLFDPFFRLDTSRARETGGVGLGLAIVKNGVQAGGGTVTAHNRTDGTTGLVIELLLPAA